MVLEVAPDGAQIGLEDGSQRALPLAELSWARAQLEEGRGPEVTAADQVVERAAVEPGPGKD